ncbi:hypothetical protein [Mesorhizobium sp. M1027]|uniref:hypothetical protein n=1 Tax=Mesorhizobium sp. M1027 TaxID=2957050 RepID=UPI00333A6A14
MLCSFEVREIGTHNVKEDFASVGEVEEIARHAVDPKVVAEINNLLDQYAGAVPVPVHKLAAVVRLRLRSHLSIATIEALIVDEAECRHLPMLFELPATHAAVVSSALGRAI